MSMSSGGRVRGAALGLAAALLCAPALGLTGASRAAAASRAAGRGRVVLEDQTQWVVPTSATSPSPFVLDLATRTAPGSSVSVSVFARLRTRDDFENAVRNGPRGYPVARTAPTAVSRLPPDPHTRGGVDLSLAVVAGSTTPTAPGATIGLGCGTATVPGTCTGVYPVEVTLSSRSGAELDRLTTFLTYQATKSAHPLELATVVRVAATVGVDSRPSGPDALGRPPAKQVAAIGSLLGVVRASDAVPLTLDVSPESLLAMRSSRAGRAAVSTLASISAGTSGDQVVAGAFAPIALGALAAAGEPTEIAAQVAEGPAVLRSLHVATSSGPLTWIAEGPVGKGFASGLTQVGATQVVLPGSDLAPATTVSTTGTFASTFALGSRGSASRFRGALTDTWLDGQFDHVQGDPGLAATQVLADLAMVHFERPNTPAVRGMVAVTPDASRADAAFYRVLLAGLDHNPDVTPVTLAQYFSTVTSDGTRTLATSASAPVVRRPLADAISRARVRLSEFDGAVDGRPAILGELDDDLLAAESSDLTPRRQTSAVATFERLLSGQLKLVSIASSTFTLTARTGVIPVTVDSRAAYTVVGTLAVSGNKFIFPHTSSRPGMHLGHATNLWRVDVEVRTSGDLPLHAVFTSPDGHLVIAEGLLTVRSTATSVVGIALSVAALAILLAWWARTWWTGRKRRRRIGPVTAT